jgi:hypothetical protein
LSHFDSLPEAVNLFRKPLKTMVFISQKFLDTPLFRLIRFRQKVLTALPPLELFSLEKKRPPFAGWPFYLVVSHRSSVVSQQEIRKDGMRRDDSPYDFVLPATND